MDFSDSFCWWFVKFLESVGFCLMPFFFFLSYFVQEEKHRLRSLRAESTKSRQLPSAIFEPLFLQIVFSTAVFLLWLSGDMTVGPFVLIPQVHEALVIYFLFYFYFFYNFFSLCYPDWIISVLFSGSLPCPHSPSFHFIWSLLLWFSLWFYFGNCILYFLRALLIVVCLVSG